VNIKENLIPREHQNLIEDTLTSGQFPWFFYNYSVNRQNIGKKVVRDLHTHDTAQFTHVFIREGKLNSSFDGLIEPFLSTLNIQVKDVYRAQANMLTMNGAYPKDHYQYPHVDFALEDDGTTSLLYYVNDSDGDTFFFNEKVDTNVEVLGINRRENPKKGKSVMFKSNTLHAGSPPRFHKSRIVINFVFNKDRK
jgi:2OG-Fe(II) oxygenase superfamily